MDLGFKVWCSPSQLQVLSESQAIPICVGLEGLRFTWSFRAYNPSLTVLKSLPSPLTRLDFWDTRIPYRTESAHFFGACGL